MFKNNEDDRTRVGQIVLAWFGANYEEHIRSCVNEIDDRKGLEIKVVPRGHLPELKVVIVTYPSDTVKEVFLRFKSAYLNALREMEQARDAEVARFFESVTDCGDLFGEVSSEEK